MTDTTNDDARTKARAALRAHIKSLLNGKQNRSFKFTDLMKDKKIMELTKDFNPPGGILRDVLDSMVEAGEALGKKRGRGIEVAHPNAKPAARKKRPAKKAAKKAVAKKTPTRRIDLNKPRRPNTDLSSDDRTAAERALRHVTKTKNHLERVLGQTLMPPNISIDYVKKTGKVRVRIGQVVMDIGTVEE